MSGQEIAFRISEQQEEYLSDWMQKVSRSFALVVPFVEEPLTHYLSTAYLLCRVADNIEDCLQPVAWKQARFAELATLLEAPSLAAEVLPRWQQEEWPGLTDDEQAIMESQYGAPLWEIYQDIPEPSRDVIGRWVLAMAEGMASLDEPGREPRFVNRDGVQVLGEEADYDGYCYIVAGTVGHMSTELVVQHYDLDAEATTRLRTTAEACGRGLQKTNIVKDFAKDLNRGVCYLPDRWLQDADYTPLALDGAPRDWSQQVIDNVLDDLRAATDYLIALPYAAEGYRMASLLCLLPAYQTLLLAAQKGPDLFTPEHQVKISREIMGQCLEDGRRLLCDNEGIAEYSRRIKTQIRATLGAPSAFNGNGAG